jgi:GDP-L-fucose synthase
MKIYVAGHRGLVGSAITRAIEADYPKYNWIGKTRDELNLFDKNLVMDFVQSELPDVVIIAAARVGGIVANNTYPVEFLAENLEIEMNLLKACHESNIEKVVFLGSSCIYPRLSPQPIKEEYLLTGELEPTNEAYALSKIAGIKLVQSYRRQYGHPWISVMPTNLYGPGDNFDLESSHVLPAMIRKFHDAKIKKESSVQLWGTGSPRREFLHVDDLAKACLFLIDNYNDDIPLNVGCGEDISIKQLAETVSRAVGFSGKTEWDTSKPDGTPRKLLDIGRIKELGWSPTIGLQEGVQSTYEWYLNNAN